MHDNWLPLPLIEGGRWIRPFIQQAQDNYSEADPQSVEDIVYFYLAGAAGHEGALGVVKTLTIDGMAAHDHAHNYRPSVLQYAHNRGFLENNSLFSGAFVVHHI